MSSPDAAPTERIVRLVGVYDADSTRARRARLLGRCPSRSTALLAVRDHPRIGPSTTRVEGLPGRACRCRSTPSIATTSPTRSAPPRAGRHRWSSPKPTAGHVLLLAPDDLEACDGSIDRLVEAIEHAVTARPDMGDSVKAASDPPWVMPRSCRRDMTLDVGDPFPDVELVDHEGRPWRTAEMRGRPLVLVLHRHLA